MIKQIWQQLPADNNIYAIIDGAANNKIHAHIVAYETPAAALLTRDDAPQSCCPWLVALQEDEDFTNWFLNDGFFNNWGIIAGSALDMPELAEHLKNYLQIYSEPDQTVSLLRFYDPRVFYSFTLLLDGLNDKDFFRQITYVAAPSPFKPDNMRLITGEGLRSVSLEQTKSGSAVTEEDKPQKVENVDG